MTYLVAASLCAIIAAGFDLKIRKIPNLITGPAFIAGLLLHLSIDGGRGLLTSLTAGVIVGLIFLVFYLAGGMGAGDVKLIAAVACIAGFGHISYLLIFTALAGGVMGVGFALIHGQLRQTLQNVLVIVGHHRQRGLEPHADLNVKNSGTLRLPYGLAIAAGSVLTLCLQSGWRMKL